MHCVTPCCVLQTIRVILLFVVLYMYYVVYVVFNGCIMECPRQISHLVAKEKQDINTRVLLIRGESASSINLLHFL